MVRDLLPYPIMMGTTTIKSDGGHIPWSEAQIALAEQHARPDLARAVTLMANTGQRGSDIVRMRLTDIEERDNPLTGRRHPGLCVVQKKTGHRLWVPMTDALVAVVETWRRDIRPPWLLLTKPDGEAYTREQLSWHWNDQRDNQAALEPLKAAGLVLHGLRGACVVRLRKAGASVLQICSMIGMSEPMAMAAVHYLNAGTAGEQKPANQTKNTESKP
jgi:integrase